MIPSPAGLRVFEREERCEPLPSERNEMALRMLATNCDAGVDILPTMAHKEGRLTARRHKPHSRLDQKTVSVSSTVSCNGWLMEVRVWGVNAYGVHQPWRLVRLRFGSVQSLRR